MRINKFKTFESNSEFIDYSEIKELFIELLDMGFKFESFDVSYPGEEKGYNGKYFFQFTKGMSGDVLGYVEKDNYYGYTNIDYIRNDFNNILSIVNMAKDSLESRGYLIAFELEFNYSIEPLLSIVCHMQHEQQINNDE